MHVYQDSKDKAKIIPVDMGNLRAQFYRLAGVLDSVQGR